VETDQFRFSLHGPGVAIDKEVDQSVALALMQVALGASRQNAIISSSSGASASSVGARPQLSLREFVDGVRAKSNPEKMTAFGIYVREHLGRESFSRDEIKGLFRSAGEALPANFPRDFKSAIQSGWIAPDQGAVDLYYVTRRGDEMIKQQ